VRLKRSHKTNPEVVQDRLEAAGLLVYRCATRRRKDVRITSKYLKILTRNAGDPLLIKTAGCRINVCVPRRSPPNCVSILAARKSDVLCDVLFSHSLATQDRRHHIRYLLYY